jgi:mannose-6-phosphate isomerase-like protein (cupin superfamily)
LSCKNLIAVILLTMVWISAASAHDQKTQAADNGKDSIMTQAISIIDLPKSDTNYAPVLKPPLSRNLRSGYVTLAPGTAGEEHSTEAYEEMIVVIEGSAIMHSGDIDRNFTAVQVAYVPPHTIHLMKNGGSTVLKYLYIVTKTE